MNMLSERITVIMRILIYCVFIGLCIQTGTILYSFLVSLFINPVAASDLYMGLNLALVRDVSMIHYCIITILLIALMSLKAYMAYWVIVSSQKLKMIDPFNGDLIPPIQTILRLSIFASVVSVFGYGYAKWLNKFNIVIPIDWGPSELLLFAAIIHFIIRILLSGRIVQLENQLTI